MDHQRTIDLTLYEVLVSARRTSLRMDQGRAVPQELVDRLCRLATWAPNHKKTWPWRFALFHDGSACADLPGGVEAGFLLDEGARFRHHHRIGRRTRCRGA